MQDLILAAHIYKLLKSIFEQHNLKWKAISIGSTKIKQHILP